MVCDACITTYIVYIWYSVLWIFTLSVGDFDCLIHILNVSFKIWADQQPKNDFILILNVFQIEIILKYNKYHIL